MHIKYTPDFAYWVGVAQTDESVRKLDYISNHLLKRKMLIVYLNYLIL